MMKKLWLILIIVFFSFEGTTSASELMEKEKGVEVKDQATKMFIYDSLATWMTHDISDFYLRKYNAESIQWEGPRPERIRIWIKEVSPGIENSSYTHILRVFMPYEKVLINNKEEIKAADTYIYAVNAIMLSQCPDSGKSVKEIKLIKSYHKVGP